MTSISRTVTVDQPVEKVSAYLCDFSTSQEWDPHTVSCRRLDGDAPLGVGSRFENVQHLAGRDTPLTYTVVEYEPGRRIVLEGGNGTVHSRDEMRFEPTPDGGTQVTYSVDLELSGAARLATPVMPLALKKIADEGAESMAAKLAAL